MPDNVESEDRESVRPMDYVFEYQSVTSEGVGNMQDIASAATTLLYKIKSKVPSGRYQSLAVTALEECAMYANKGISHPEP